jgi:hypothetical protein
MSLVSFVNLHLDRAMASSRWLRKLGNYNSTKDGINYAEAGSKRRNLQLLNLQKLKIEVNELNMAAGFVI